MTIAIDVIDNTTWRAAALAFFGSPLPMYCEHRIVPPVAIAEKSWMTRLLMASVRETAEIAALPIRVTIMESAMPMKLASRFSIISGISSFQIADRSNIMWSQSILAAS